MIVIKIERSDWSEMCRWCIRSMAGKWLRKTRFL